MTDIDIARGIKLKKISEVASDLGLCEEDYDPYGRYKGKLNVGNILKERKGKKGKLILVTAITPTPSGEGKTTTSIGITQGLNKIGASSIVALREPSLGPVFGMKGGAAGGGYSQVLPMEDINLHFTGDIHGITSAHNLISATIDNHLKFGNELGIDPTKITWKRVMDLNDRALRNIVVGLGGSINGTPREDSFQITVASEIMAILCLADSLKDLKRRIKNIVIGQDYKGKLVRVEDLKVAGAATALLKEAIKPNLVQTTEGTPAIIHGGPFANIAHGCSSILGTKTALALSDYVVTEGGFGADLGGEKFLDIKCRNEGIDPDIVVMVATIRALKYHGCGRLEDGENLEALKKGVVNLEKHLENIKKFNLPVVVAINKFKDDTDNEIEFLIDHLEKLGVKGYSCDIWGQGGDGAIEISKYIVEAVEKQEEPTFKHLYDLDLSIKEKIETIAREIYGADGVDYTVAATKKIELLNENGYSNLPICISKTPKSISDNPKLLGRPEGFRVSVRDVRGSIGAGFIVVETGKVIDMPGLPRNPASENIDIDDEGNISGLF